MFMSGSRCRRELMLCWLRTLHDCCLMPDYPWYVRMFRVDEHIPPRLCPLGSRLGGATFELIDLLVAGQV